LKLYEVMEKIFESTRNLLPFENGLIFLPDKDPDEFTVKAFFGYEENYIKEQRFTFRKGQGYTGWIIKNKKPLLIEDSKSRTDIKPLYPYIKKNKLLRSFMGVPLIVRDQVVGVFEITSEKPQVFKKEHLNLLRAFADQLAIAIDRARLFEETDNRARQLASLYDTGRSILSNLTLDEVLKKIANSAKEVLKADIVDLYQYDTDQNDFIMPPTLVGDRHFPKLIPQKLSNNALVVKVVREMKPRYFSKAQKEPDLIKPKPLQPEEVWKPKNRFVIREKIKSSALIPCIAKGVVVGVLCVSYRTSIHFTPHEKEIIEIFATLAATAIENARLHKTTDEELNKRVKELSSLRRADGAMVSTLEIDRVIKVILDEIRQLIGADCALVRLYRKEIRDGTPDVLVLAEVKGSYEGEIPKYNPFGSGISGVAAQTRKTVIENNLDNSSIHSEALKYYANPEEKKYLKWIKSVVTTPLISKGELKGVLCALKPVKDGFLNIDLNIVESFASRAAIAIDNALLKSQQEERI
jgi:GAF domain-containing protein